MPHSSRLSHQNSLSLVVRACLMPSPSDLSGFDRSHSEEIDLQLASNILDVNVLVLLYSTHRHVLYSYSELQSAPVDRDSIPVVQEQRK